jgi:acetolactate synthase regulatory subunit
MYVLTNGSYLITCIFRDIKRAKNDDHKNSLIHIIRDRERTIDVLQKKLEKYEQMIEQYNL